MTLTTPPVTRPAATTTPQREEILDFHLGGKLRVHSSVELTTRRALSIAYSPGVAEVSDAIAERAELAGTYTWAGRLVAVVSDGTAVLGLGNIGPAAAMPVMEGKAALFKTFAGLDSIPLVLPRMSVEDTVETLVRLRHSFGAVNLEDVSAPLCFELEAALDEALDCPVMHDDQHGTAVVTLAGLRGAATVTGRRLQDLRVAVIGAGASGTACAKLLRAAGIEDITVVDSRGIVEADRTDLNPAKTELAAITNPRGLTGGIDQALRGADVLLGLSCTTVPEELIATMDPDPILFGLSNPRPEVSPEIAARYASVYATGRSDYPNQVNNVLAFPGIFKGALDAGAPRITEAMKMAAVDAISALAAEDLTPTTILPSPLDARVAPAVAAAVQAAALPS
ncbi:NAD(P)-dependent malic enzyme [Ornithinicoccus hortensis]|uniref:Malate dehydrogenase (Oxaloacetate-decarboxylating) n=1 Tax=Ornithinicoccus hortensis TaxID=82346 RepID=A0A542YV38_9MICO|nr:NADP-dependent malic enzyme [Ornithinicoccus hortensis]TQL51955.1 malate dehydrogenase (oxaloacetate-decarboxylating) [Ornithinicoccus hortensis]